MPEGGTALNLKPEELAADPKKKSENKPVSVPSWVFDKEVIKAIKEGKDTKAAEATLAEAQARAAKGEAPLPSVKTGSSAVSSPSTESGTPSKSHTPAPTPS